MATIPAPLLAPALPPPDAAATAARQTQALDVVMRHAALAAASAAVPVPLLDSAAATGVQMAMIAELSRLYGKTISQDLARTMLASLGAGALTFTFSHTRAGIALNAFALAIPVIGVPLRWIAGPAVLASYTYVLGRAMTHHYEAGGTYTDFDRRKFRAYVTRLWAEAAP